MVELLHTPGPWEYFQGDICAGKPDDRVPVIQIVNPTALADLELVAAAPDLLECLERFLGEAGKTPRAVALAIKAVNKARGIKGKDA